MPVQTPLRVEAWEKALSRHPDTAFAHYVISGLRHGFSHRFQPLLPAAFSRNKHVVSPPASRNHFGLLG